jgi:Zn-dependent protease
MLGTPSRSGELTFRLGGIPVRVHPWFLLMGMFLGLGAQGGLAGIVERAIAFLVTVFVHELSHAVVARSFGAEAEIELTLFRGALGARIASLAPGRRVLVCMAGPVVNLLAGAIALGVIRTLSLGAGAGADVLGYLCWINLAWGLLNLLPILPLDAAHALAAALDRTTRGRGEPIVRCVSIGAAVMLGGAALALRMTVPAFICALLAFQNVRASGLARDRANIESILRVRLRAAFDALERGETAIAIGHCCTVLGASTDMAVRKDAIRLLAYAYATGSDWGKLIDLLETGGAQALDDVELEKYHLAVRELGRSEDAQRIASLQIRLARGNGT